MTCGEARNFYCYPVSLRSMQRRQRSKFVEAHINIRAAVWMGKRFENKKAKIIARPVLILCKLYGQRVAALVKVKLGRRTQGM
jgi:hypothetical protein